MLYPQKIEQKLGFTEIRQLLQAHCLSPMGKGRVEDMQFVTSPQVVRQLHAQVAEYGRIMEEETEMPPQDFFDLRADIHRIAVEGTYLEEQQMWELYRSLQTLHAWVALIRRNDEENHVKYPALEQLAQGVFTFLSVTKRVEQILDKYGRIKDEASPELANIRRQLRQAEGSVSHTLQSILRKAQAEGLVEKDVSPTLRDGRLVIPVMPDLKKRLRGIVHDESASGKTVFIEPADVVEANNRIRELEAEERREIIHILRTFT